LELSQQWPEAEAHPWASNISASQHSRKSRWLLLKVLPAATLALLLASAALAPLQRHLHARASVRKVREENADFLVAMLQPAAPHWNEPMCTFPDEDREDCGWDGMLEWQCRKAGCCYGEPNGPNLPFCYHGKDATLTATPPLASTPSSTTTLTTVPASTLPVCTFPDEEREDCGWNGVLEWQCIQAGCCYGEPQGPNLPFCYHGKKTTHTATTSLTTTPLPTTTLTTVPPSTLPTTITATTTTTTTKTGGSSFKGDDDRLTRLDSLGVKGPGGWDFRMVPLLISAVAACLMGAIVTGLIVGRGRCRRYQAKSGAYNEREMSPARHGNYLFNSPSGRNHSIRGGSYHGLDPNSQRESIQSSPAESWVSSRVQNPV